VSTDLFRPRPQIAPALDPAFRPAVLANRALRDEAQRAGAQPLAFALERPDGSVSRFTTVALGEDHPHATVNLTYAERILKFLLWQRGGFKVHVAGPTRIAEHLARCYSATGERAFDAQFMGTQVYERPFEVVGCLASQLPEEREVNRPLGRHLDGCRIGFDLGASDRKVSAVIDGQGVFSEEVVWAPGAQTDPEYHYREIMAALRRAAAYLPRIDAIGGSSAGVIVDNEPRVASLFRGVPQERFAEVRRLFLRIRGELGVPLEVVNDGEVTALAGSMALEANAILGVALGSSEAAGYVTPEGNITGWLNELAFAPIDYSETAPLDEWSGDRGVGALYFSQQCVFRLAPKVGIDLPERATPAERLKLVQERLEAGDEGALQIWQTMGTYLGYGLAHYADFYPLEHVLILGRCTSGRGGALLLEGARAVLAAELPELERRLALHLPDEKTRRVGQSIAAASLPALACA
jgi:predicted NBD/HSP70 family sugar kinase